MNLNSISLADVRPFAHSNTAQTSYSVYKGFIHRSESSVVW